MRCKVTVPMGEPQIKGNMGFTYTTQKDGIDEALMSIIMSDLRGRKAKDVINRAINTLDKAEAPFHRKTKKPSSRKRKKSKRKPS